jgi:hypothetical protein
MSTDAPPADPPSQWGLAALGGVGLAVAAVLAAYAKAHPGEGAALTTLWFGGVLEMKAWLTTAATSLVVVQVLSALAMWGRLPGVAHPPGWVAGLHRWAGVTAFLLTLPVVFHCVWSLGFEDESTRVLVHSVVGCAFYGIFAAKMLALRLRGLPGATVPVLGGLLAGALVVLWFSSAFWFFGQSGDVGY